MNFKELKKAKLQAMRDKNIMLRDELIGILAHENFFKKDAEEISDELVVKTIASIKTKYEKAVEQLLKGKKATPVSEDHPYVVEYKQRIEVLKELMPDDGMLSEDEIRQLIDENEFSEIREYMAFFKVNYAKVVDNSVVARLVKEKLSK